MSFLEDLLRPRADWEAPSVSDDGHWTTHTGGASVSGGVTTSGVWLTPDRALRASPVWACVRLLSESLASLPLIMYRRLSDGGKERAIDHPLYAVLHDQPNALQTAFRFKRAMMVQALLYGNAYARKVPGIRGPVDQLEMIHAALVREEPIGPGSIRYMVANANGGEDPVNAEDIFHIRGLSVDGITGLSLIQYAREAIGLGLAASEYSGRFYSNDARPGGVLQVPKRLTDEAYSRLRDSWNQKHAGLSNAHAVAILEEGTEWQAIGMTNEDAQLIAQLEWSAEEVARFFNVPLHMIQLVSKSTSWGSGIEEMTIGYVTYSLLPWARNWEDEIRSGLIIANQTYFAEFLMDGLLRGKLSERYAAYNIGRQAGFLSTNDIRRKENMNPIPGGDVYLQPLNMAPAGSSQARESGDRIDSWQADHYQILVHEAIARIMRKEVSAIGRLARQIEGDEAWETGVCSFYDSHGAFVAAVLGVSEMAGERYAAARSATLCGCGPHLPEGWEQDGMRALGDLVAERGSYGHT